MRKLTQQQLDKIKNTQPGYGVFTQLAAEMRLNVDYVKQLWHKMNPPKQRKCECSRVATVPTSLGVCCERCARIQELLKEH